MFRFIETPDSFGILRRSPHVVMSPRSLHRAVNRDATFGTESHYFSYSLTIRPWTRGGDSEAEEELLSGGPSALLEVRRRRKCPAAIVWGRFNKRRCHRTRLSLLFLFLSLFLSLSYFSIHLPYTDVLLTSRRCYVNITPPTLKFRSKHKTMNGSRFL